MRGSRLRIGLLKVCPAAMLFLSVFLASGPVWAAKITVKIKVLNPLDKAQPFQIKEYLPQRITTNDVINLDGLDLGYDVKAESYYVFKDIELGPKQVFARNVEIKDIWNVSAESIDAMKKRLADMAGLLKGKPDGVSAEGLRQEAERILEIVGKRQEENVVKPGTRVQDHITAYESNLLNLRRVKEAVGALENMVMASGQDPGGLVGELKNLPEPDHKIEMPTNLMKVAVYKVSVRNPLPKQVKKDWANELPSEIKIADIRKTDGLSVRFDSKTGAVFVYTNDLVLAAGETRTFSVEIWDKWNINSIRTQNLKGAATNMLARIGNKEKYPSIVNALTGVFGELEKIEAEPVPKKLDAQYVAFFREQGARLDRIENQINRINAALRPMDKNPKMGFNAKAPSPKTTWMIIYVILGFLALVSLVFFFRWVSGGSGKG